MKKYLALLLAVLMLAAVFTGCASKETTTDTPAASTDTAEPAKTDENTAAEETPAAEPASEEGKVFNIYAWNEEFKGFFEKYYTVPEGVTVNWIITPSDNGAYQEKLDEALLNQENASADDKVDLFLAEADYIQKYTESPVTQDVTALGVTDFSNTYAYTVQAASDASGVVKGVSFQCCPAALIYRRSIAKDVLGTDGHGIGLGAIDGGDQNGNVLAAWHIGRVGQREDAGELDGQIVPVADLITDLDFHRIAAGRLAAAQHGSGAQCECRSAGDLQEGAAGDLVRHKKLPPYQMAMSFSSLVRL